MSQVLFGALIFERSYVAEVLRALINMYSQRLVRS